MKLLVGIDLSDDTDTVVTQTGIFAKALAARVWLVHAAEPDPADMAAAAYEPDSLGLGMDPQSLRNSLAERFHREHQQIQSIADRLRKAGLDATALLVQGAAADSILNMASKLEVDMILVGSHGRSSMYQLIVGSTSEGVLRKSACPVLVIPTHKDTRPGQAV
jgi:nucleotide-binding universal stress UspA family protein